MLRKTTGLLGGKKFSVVGLLIALSLGTAYGFNVYNSSRAATCSQVGDFNCDTKVDIVDLSILLSHFNSHYANAVSVCDDSLSGSQPADLDCNGVVNIIDLSRLLSKYGQEATVAAPGPDLKGANMHPFEYMPDIKGTESVSDYDRDLDMLKAAGGNVVRLDISWADFEPLGKGQLDEGQVARVRTFLDHAAARNIKVVAVSTATACWASTAPDSLKKPSSASATDPPCYKPDPDAAGPGVGYSPSQSFSKGWWKYPAKNLNDYGDFMANVAQWFGYGPSSAHPDGSPLVAIEVWNEPNIADFNLAPDRASVYAATLKTAYPRIKAASPNLIVLGATTAGSDGDFLNQLYALGIKGSFDAISIHPYNGNKDPDSPANLAPYKKDYFRYGIPWIHDIMTAHGDGDKGIWLTEFGWAAGQPGTGFTTVTADQQAEFINDYFRYIKDWSYVKAAIVYQLRDGYNDKYGLIQRDFTPRPSYQAFSDAAVGKFIGDRYSGSDYPWCLRAAPTGQDDPSVHCPAQWAGL